MKSNELFIIAFHPASRIHALDKPKPTEKALHIPHRYKINIKYGHDVRSCIIKCADPMSGKKQKQPKMINLCHDIIATLKRPGLRGEEKWIFPVSLPETLPYSWGSVDEGWLAVIVLKSFGIEIEHETKIVENEYHAEKCPLGLSGL